MVLGAFPLGKIIILGIKHIIKPVSQVFKTVAKHNPVFRKCLCAPAGQFVYSAEVKCKMHMLNLPQPNRIPRLRENIATDLGANILGEIFVVTIGIGLIYYEVSRQLLKDKNKHDSHVHHKMELERKISRLNNLVEWQDEELKNVRLKLSEYCRLDD